jgi:hypothetical protein
METCNYSPCQSHEASPDLDTRSRDCRNSPQPLFEHSGTTRALSHHAGHLAKVAQVAIYTFQLRNGSRDYLTPDGAQAETRRLCGRWYGVNKW